MIEFNQLWKTGAMGASKVELLEISKEGFFNARELFISGDILAEKSKWGTATSLLVLSIEEAFKGLVFLMDSQGKNLRNKLDFFKKFLTNHETRHNASGLIYYAIGFLQHILPIITSETKIENIDLKSIDFINESTDWFENLDSLKQRGFYVGFASGQVFSPKDIIETDYYEARRYADHILILCEKLLVEVENNGNTSFIDYLERYFLTPAFEDLIKKNKYSG